MQKSAIECVIEIMRNGGRWSSEALQAEIRTRFDQCYKVSNIERRCRQDDRVLSRKVHGKNYNDYSLI
jgi:hypothetical protein